MGIFSKKPLELNDIISGCAAGKSSAQKALFEKFYGFSMKICLRYGANAIEAEEMVNDSFLKVFKHIETFTVGQNFHAWFKTITVRTCIDYHRKHHSRVGLIDVAEVPHLEFNEPSAISSLEANEILELVQKLPPSYRTVFSMFAIDGYSHAEIAEMLGINEGTSRSNLAKARLKLQDWIKIYANEKITK